MADDFPIILEARADTTQFFKDIVDATNKAQKSVKPIRLGLDDKASLPLKRLSGEVSEFNKSLDAATARVVAFSATTGVLYGVVNAFKALVRETIEVEKTMTEIQTVLNTNQKGLERFNSTLFDIAKNTAQSYKAVSTAALELSRQGLSVEETLKRTQDALILTRISGLDAAQAVDTLTAAMNGFGKSALDATDIVNKLAAVDSAFAVSTKDLAESLTRVGATAQDANVTFEELVATVTAVQQTTSRGGAVIGNALKTIFTRIGRQDTIDQLRELGVAIDESQGGIQKLQAISERIKEVDTSTANFIKELAGGVFQINVVSAAIGDLSKEFSIYDNAIRVANNSTDEAIRRNELLNTTLAASISQAGTGIQELLSKFGRLSLGDNLKTIFASFNDGLSALTDSLDGEEAGFNLGKGLLEGFGNFLTGPGLTIAVGAFFKLTKTLVADAYGAFKQVAGITTETDKQAILQKQIGSFLEANAARYAGIKGSVAQINALQQDFLSALGVEARLRADIAAISKTTASNLVGQTILRKEGGRTSLAPKGSGFASSLFVPNNASEGYPGDAIQSSAMREVKALVGLGYTKQEAAASLRIGKSPFLVSEQNPLGFGIYNKLQGQNSLADAFNDHKGENLKYVGAGDSIVPNLTIPMSSEMRFPDRDSREQFIKSLDLSGINFDVQATKIRKQIKQTVESALDFKISDLNPSARTSYSKLVTEILTLRATDIESIKTLQTLGRDRRVSETLKKKTSPEEYNNFVRSEASQDGTYPTSGSFFSAAQSKIDKSFKALKTATDEQVDGYVNFINRQAKEAFTDGSQDLKDVQSRLDGALKARKNAAQKAIADAEKLKAQSFDSVLSKGRERIGQQGFFSSLLGFGSTISNTEGFKNLSPQQKAEIRKTLQQEGSARRSTRVQDKSLGFALAGSFVSPFLDQAAESQSAAGNNRTAGALNTGSSALQGASIGILAGPVGAAIGAGLGAAYGILDWVDQSDEKFKQLSQTLEDLNAQNSTLINSFSTYIQLQDKLSSIIDSGGSPKDIQAVSRQISQTFSSISDPEARSRIISSGGDIKELSSALAQVQSSQLNEQKRLEAVVIASKERDRLTNFYGTADAAFKGDSIRGVSSSLVGSIEPEKLAIFQKSFQDLQDNFSDERFNIVLQSLGLDAKQTTELVGALGDSVNKLALVSDIKERIDFSRELQESIDKTVKFKTAITDLSKTLSSITAIEASNRRTGFGIQGNRFAEGQNASRNAASLRFFNASQFAQAQLSTGFDIQQTRFSASQGRGAVVNDLREQVASFITENRLQLKNTQGLSESLNDFVKTGRGDIASLANEALSKGVLSGEDNKTFSELASLLNQANNSLVSIDDNEKSQIRIAQDNLRATKDRLELQNRVNLLGGAEGQIGFGREGLDRFRNRDISANLGGRAGELGVAGRADQALGILDFQKAFSNIEGLDTRKLIPNAEQIVRDSIKENLLQGLGRVGVEVTPDQVREIDEIAKASAASSFERQELTADEIGKAVSSSFNYTQLATDSENSFSNALGSSVLTSNSNAIPSIYKILETRFNLQSQRLETQVGYNAARDNSSKLTNTIDSLAKDSKALTRDNARITRGEGASFDILDKSQEKIAQDIMQAMGGSNNPLKSLNSILSRNLFGVAGNSSVSISKDELEKNANSLLNSNYGGSTNPKLGLLAALGQGGVTETGGRRNITQQGLDTLLEKFTQAGAVSLPESVTKKINENEQSISSLTTQLDDAKTSVESFEAALNRLDKAIDTQSKSRVKSDSGINLGKVVQDAGSALTNLFNGSRYRKVFDGFVDAVEKSRNDLDAQTAQQVNKTAIQSKDSITKFGNDFAVRDALTRSRTDLSELGPLDKRLQILTADINALTVAQKQRVGTGSVNDELLTQLKRVGYTNANNRGRGNDGLGEALNRNNLEFRATSLASEIRDGYGSGSSQNELRLKAIEIQKTLDRYVESQVSLGYDRAQVQQTAKQMKDIIQKELDDIDIKLPRGKLDEFATGFTGRLEELQQNFDDLAAVGAQTAESLATGFGDAFVDVVSGAKTAEEAVRGLLSSVASDLARFFAKRAFVNLFAASLGGSSGYGGFNQGGVVKRANGGPIGKVPALVMGGEYKFDRNVVSAYGEDFFRDLNSGKIDAPKYASGGRVESSGLIRGGSGNKDDIFGQFDEGSFILRKSAVSKYGTKFLNQIAKAPESSRYNNGGRVQKAFWGALLGAVIGGAVQGAVVGAGVSALTGGDVGKGALIGGIGGGLVGGFTGFNAAQASGSSFGSGFKGSFSYLGLGKDSSGKTVAGAEPVGSGNVSNSTLELNGIQGGPQGTTFSGPSVSDANGGFASGVGNNSLSVNQIQPSSNFDGAFSNSTINGPTSASFSAPRPSYFKQFAGSLATAGALTGASMAISPDTNTGSTGTKIVEGKGSVTTYNEDGSVFINTSSGAKVIRPGVDYNSTTELEGLVNRYGGNLPQEGLPKFANGGPVSSEGKINVINRKSLDKMNYPKLSSPYINGGSGVKDDVKAELKKGEFVLNDEATAYYGQDYLMRMNAMQVDRSQISDDKVVRFNSGGPVEYDPSRRDRGMFSMGNQEAPSSGGQVYAGGNSNIKVEININMSADGTASGSTSVASSGGEQAQAKKTEQFGNKMRAMVLEVINQEKRPGGSLSKENS